MTETKSALIIASWRYEDTSLRRLMAPVKDAKSLARVLENPGIGGFQVTTILNKPSHLVRQQIQAFFSNRKRDDLLVLYFSGHGIKDEEGRLYFATPDTNKKLLLATSVESAFVADVMRQSYSRRQILLLDCCYSGAFLRGVRSKADKSIGTVERFRGRGRVVLTASDAMQYSFEGEEVKGKGVPSIFTRVLVDGLESGEADLDHDGLISVDELYDYVHDRVTEHTPHQTPMMSADVVGRIIIARNAGWAKEQEELQARKKREAERLAMEQAETEGRAREKAERERLNAASKRVELRPIEKAEEKILEAQKPDERIESKAGAVPSIIASDGKAPFLLPWLIVSTLWMGLITIFVYFEPLIGYGWLAYLALAIPLFGLMWLMIKLEHKPKKYLFTIWIVAAIVEAVAGIGGWNALMQGTAKGRVLTGDSLFRKRDWVGATAQYREAIRLKADYIQAYDKLGDALFNNQDWDGAVEAYRAEIELTPDDISVRNSLADALFNKGDWKGAIREYRQIIALKPDNIDASLALAQALDNNHDWNEAIAQYRQALFRDPNNIDARYDLARVLVKKQDWSSAIGEYRQIIRMKPDYQGVHKDLAYALLCKTDWQGAIDEYNEVIRLTPNDIDVHYNLGIALYNKRNYVGAAARFRRVLELQPEYFQARQALDNALKERDREVSEKREITQQ